MGGVPSIPSPPPAPPAPSPPKKSDWEIEEEKRKRQRLAAGARGYGATILTGGMGLQEAPPVKSKTLLGE
jgi:hypothetical protein